MLHGQPKVCVQLAGDSERGTTVYQDRGATAGGLYV